MNTMIAYADNLNGAVSNCPGVGKIESLTDFINFFTCTLINAVIPLLFALALAGFVYGIIKYFLNPDNEEKRKDGKSFMFWGIVTIFVMVSIWGLVGIFSKTFLPDGSNKPFLPSLPEKK
jgi:uncharacterized membrane-anchored protein